MAFMHLDTEEAAAARILKAKELLAAHEEYVTSLRNMCEEAQKIIQLEDVLDLRNGKTIDVVDSIRRAYRSYLEDNRARIDCMFWRRIAKDCCIEHAKEAQNIITTAENASGRYPDLSFVKFEQEKVLEFANNVPAMFREYLDSLCILMRDKLIEQRLANGRGKEGLPKQFVEIFAVRVHEYGFDFLAHVGTGTWQEKLDETLWLLAGDEYSMQAEGAYFNELSKATRNKEKSFQTRFFDGKWFKNERVKLQPREEALGLLHVLETRGTEAKIEQEMRESEQGEEA